MRNLTIIFIIMAITACGTTSSIKQNGEKTQDLNLSEYDSVIVNDFGDATKKSNLPEYAGPNFADRILSAIRGMGIFETVTDDKSEISGKAIVVSGDITRYAKGNAALKFIVGFGAGSTYLDANVRISDFTSQKQFGEIIVDKNSWALGGGIAAGQTVEKFMAEAAKKIANELATAKNKPAINEE